MSEKDDSSMLVANLVEESRYGGPQKRIYLVAKYLKDECDVTTIVVANSENCGIFKEQLGVGGVEGVFLNIVRPSKNIKSLIKYLIFFIPDIVKLAFVLRKRHIDVVHLSGGSWQIRSLIAAKFSNAKVIWHLNDTSVPFIIRRVFMVFCESADGFIFASERTKKYYLNIANRIERKPNWVVPAPIDPSIIAKGRSLDPTDKSTKKFESFVTTDDTVVVGTVGNISPVKGQDLLLQACVELSRQVEKKIIVVIIGNIFNNQHNFARHIQDIAKSNNNVDLIIKEGVIDISQWLEVFDFYVCASRNESSPMAVWEALAMKCTVVSSNVGDVSKYIDHQENGFLFSSGSVTELTAVLVNLVRNPNVISEIKFNDDVLEKLSLAYVGSLTCAVYNEILRR